MNQQSTFDSEQVHETQAFVHERQLLSCTFSPCGKYVVAGGMDKLVHRWELGTGQHVALAGHNSWVDALAFHPDGKRLLTTDYVGGVRCWSYADAHPQALWSHDDVHHGSIRGIAIGADGKNFATTGHDQTVRVHSAADGKTLCTLTGHKSPVFAIAIHPDSTSLVSAEQFGIVKHWNINSGKHVRDLDAGVLWTDASLNGGAHTCGIRTLRFRGGGDVLACAGITQLKDGDRRGGDGTILLLDWKSGKQQGLLQAKQAGYVENVVFHPDGAIAVCLTQEHGSVQFWKDGDAPVHQFKAPCRDLDLHPDGARLAVCEWTKHGKVGNNASTDELEEFQSHHGTIRIHSLLPPDDAANG